MPSGSVPPHRLPSLSPPTGHGLVLSPFRALRYDTAVGGDLSQLTSSPFDAQGSDAVPSTRPGAPVTLRDYNVRHLILPRPDAGNLHPYRHAAELLARWRRSGVLRPDPQPALYVYEQAARSTGAAQRGLVGALTLSPLEDRVILPHEDTMAGPLADRLAQHAALNADLEPIFLLYDGGGAASRAVATVDDSAHHPPASHAAQGPTADDAAQLLLDADLPDGLRHRIWALTDPALLAGIAADLLPRRAVIADGHHRYATYLQRQAEQHALGAGPGPWDAGLAFLVDCSSYGPQVRAVHRVLPGQPADLLASRARAGMHVQDLSGQPDQAVLAALSRAAADGPAFALASGTGAHRWLLTHPDRARLDAAVPVNRSPAWRALDVVALHCLLIGDLWSMADTEQTVWSEPDVDAALTAAAGSHGTAVLLNPTPVAAVAAVAAAGEQMPHTSTQFLPKPRSGLLIRDYRDA